LPDIEKIFYSETSLKIPIFRRENVLLQKIFFRRGDSKFQNFKTCWKFGKEYFSK